MITQDSERSLYNVSDQTSIISTFYTQIHHLHHCITNLVKADVVSVFEIFLICRPLLDHHITVSNNINNILIVLQDFCGTAFLGWVFSLGDGIKIVWPDDVVEQMRMEIKRLTEQYSYDLSES